ncbi:MAG: ATP-binding protein [Sphingomonadales bacterium]|nr:ATP-binding protein [Sphingomonadales bacterium]PIX64685.1 MAG: ATPase [Sphingomonadales bacterium CG_4_10_14_3_um_filter_58_15]NCO48453.1 ATP-binding protein [Sphingomonadales bacterium]NCO99269.1 ATP-binding protein [Sphingomonadales bacterium]NCP27717.1 ATP-binding protein [Sphingomonadales bacterium]
MTGAGNDDILARIADALERLAPPATAPVDLAAGEAFLWDGHRIRAISPFDPIEIDLLTGIDQQKASLLENTGRHARGHAAHDVLLWGSRGMGKSALSKSVVRALQAQGEDIALVEAPSGQLEKLPALFEMLASVQRSFVIFIDDIGFVEGSAEPRLLRSMLEGGASERPANVRLYVTSNRRHIVSRQMSEQDDPVNPRDMVDDQLALSDRFGLRLGFHAASQDDYLAMIIRYADAHGLDFEREDALLWAKQRGSRSGRVAWQYIVELAGRTGRSLV